MSVDILVRFTDSQAARLAEHKRLTLVPTSAFIRLAIERALGHQIVDAIAEPGQKTDALATRRIPIILTPQPKAEVKP